MNHITANYRTLPQLVILLLIVLFFYSCQEIDHSPDSIVNPSSEAKVIPPTLDPSGRVSFANLISFSDFLEKNIDKSLEELSLFEGKFVSLRERNIALAETNPALLRVLEDDVEEDSIIVDEFTASLVNEKRELMIDGKVVRYTAFGTWVYHDDFTARVEELLPTMTNAQMEEIYATHDFAEDPFYELEPGIFLFGTTEQAEAEMELKTVDYSNAAIASGVAPNLFNYYYCNRTSNKRTFTNNPSHWTGGVRVTEYIYFESNRRMKAKVWTTNYGTHSTGGYFTKLQRRRLGVWWASEADIVSLSVRAKTYHPDPVNSIYFPLPYQPGPLPGNNGTEERFGQNKVNILWPPYTMTFVISPGQSITKQCKPEYDFSPGTNPIPPSKPVPCKPLWKFSKRVKIKESESCHYVKEGSREGEIQLFVKESD